MHLFFWCVSFGRGLIILSLSLYRIVSAKRGILRAELCAHLCASFSFHADVRRASTRLMIMAMAHRHRQAERMMLKMFTRCLQQTVTASGAARYNARAASRLRCWGCRTHSNRSRKAGPASRCRRQSNGCKTTFL